VPARGERCSSTATNSQSSSSEGKSVDAIGSKRMSQMSQPLLLLLLLLWQTNMKT
jgi:hypothetical protein